MTMNVYFRTDASTYIGSGHVMRCLVLAQAMKEKGHQVTFVSRRQKGDLIDLIYERNFNVLELSPVNDPIEPVNNADYKSWLQVTWQQDAEEFTSMVRDVDIVIVDHYALNAEWEKQIIQHLNCSLFAIDDLVREHYADFILDQTLGRCSSEYINSKSNSLALTGCEYALLAPAFNKKRECVLDKSIIPNKLNLLISLGGIDLPNVTSIVLQTIKATIDFPLSVTVVLSARAPHYNEVVTFCQENKDWIKHISFTNDMATLMESHDLAIGAPGTTSWERACLGLPSIIIPIADNQKYITQELTAANAAICLKIGDIKAKLFNSLKELLSDYKGFKERNLSLCDGLGVYRINEIIEQSINTQKLDKPKIKLRFANTKDIKQVYKWQCLPETRKYALNPKVPSWEEHSNWMSNKLKSTVDYFYIIQLYNPNEGQWNNVGVVRLDRMTKKNYLITISLAPNSHGKGIGFLCLTYLNSIHKYINIHATVVPENKASQRIFIKANYEKISPQEFIHKSLD
ncbi:UDP-2,4-diacetamido-2,4,6-trideoxy-beta-L-altropyranose hydrolase [Colwellia sp. 6_MG-2023]|uniref:UDP-2,4-diacetamido-2,4, 6-trideoxy-beta-L-altropyranose hydrolase n=1 Tax=Colwellia sp. 6_MG-2023 TaxID=3062676 RepID=UPI0026E16939|nr:UDP-2,4-diacetamido-2,4,6-trideoxy-beta-L-altropyranose hydrolase [Colwellia sp. 6_MG-2023]MDO6488129.1 UDP-2,4-diacetamido-2,4,6-trideoxy-beta-L-altropyranose hydrolase [Colwellia sp. 6_MG-2023]